MKDETPFTNQRHHYSACPALCQYLVCFLFLRHQILRNGNTPLSTGLCHEPNVSAFVRERGAALPRARAVSLYIPVSRGKGMNKAMLRHAFPVIPARPESCPAPRPIRNVLGRIPPKAHAPGTLYGCPVPHSDSFPSIFNTGSLFPLQLTASGPQAVSPQRPRGCGEYRTPGSVCEQLFILCPCSRQKIFYGPAAFFCPPSHKGGAYPLIGRALPFPVHGERPPRRFRPARRC